MFVLVLHFRRLLHVRFLLSQINGRPVIGNGGFPFSSMPNGNAYYSENKWAAGYVRTAEGRGCDWNGGLAKAGSFLSPNMSRVGWGQTGRWTWTLFITCNLLFDFWMFDQLWKKKKQFGLTERHLWSWVGDLDPDCWYCWWKAVATADAVSHLPTNQTKSASLRLHLWQQKTNHLTCFSCF